MARSYFTASGSDKMLLLISNGVSGISTQSRSAFETKNPTSTFNSFKFRIYTANGKLYSSYSCK